MTVSPTRPAIMARQWSRVATRRQLRSRLPGGNSWMLCGAKGKDKRLSSMHDMLAWRYQFSHQHIDNKTRKDKVTARMWPRVRRQRDATRLAQALGVGVVVGRKSRRRPAGRYDLPQRLAGVVVFHVERLVARLCFGLLIQRWLSVVFNRMNSDNINVECLVARLCFDLQTNDRTRNAGLRVTLHWISEISCASHGRPSC